MSFEVAVISNNSRETSYGTTSVILLIFPAYLIIIHPFLTGYAAHSCNSRNYGALIGLMGEDNENFTAFSLKNHLPMLYVQSRPT